MARTLDEIIAAAVAAALAQQTNLVAAAPAAPAPATPPVAAVDAVAASQITGTLAHVAASFKGAQLDGDKSWYNGVKGAAPVYAGFSKGERVMLSLDENGRVLACERVGTESARPNLTVVPPTKPAATKPAATKPAAQAPAPATPATVADPAACLFCSGKHFKYKTEEVSRACAERQYANETGDTVTITDPASFIRYATWLLARETALVVHAFNTQGFLVIETGTPEGDPEPTPPAPSTPTPPKGRGGRKNATKPAAPQAAAPAAPRKGGRASATDAEILAAGERLLTAAPQAAAQAAAPATPPARPAAYQGLYVNPAPAAPRGPKPAPMETQRVGTWDGLIRKHATSTANARAGLFCFVSASLPGCKPNGDWIKPADPALVPTILKTAEGDRVRITLNVAGDVTAFEVLGTLAKEAGHVPGIKTSGRNQPAEPKRQPADKKVATARAAKAAERKAAKAAASATEQPAAAPTPADDDIDAKLAAATARKLAAAPTPPAPKLTAEQLEQIEQAQARHGKVPGIRVNRRTNKLEPIFRCSGTATHRTTCFGRCVE